MEKTKSPKVIAIWNLKGGVGKSTTAIHLAYYLSIQSYRTLLLDFDEQSNTSFFFEKSLIKQTKKNIQDVLENPDYFYKSIYRTQYTNLDFIRNGNRVLQFEMNSENALKKMLEKSTKYKRSYDYVVIDLHPDTRSASQMALSISDLVIVPITLDGFCRDNLALVDTFLAQLGEIRAKEIQWKVFANRVRKNKNQQTILTDLILQHNYPFFQTCIRECTAVSYSLAVKKTLMQCRSKANATLDFTNLAQEILEEMEN